MTSRHLGVRYFCFLKEQGRGNVATCQKLSFILRRSEEVFSRPEKTMRGGASANNESLPRGTLFSASTLSTIDVADLTSPPFLRNDGQHSPYRGGSHKSFLESALTNCCKPELGEEAAGVSLVHGRASPTGPAAHSPWKDHSDASGPWKGPSAPFMN